MTDDLKATPVERGRIEKMSKSKKNVVDPGSDRSTNMVPMLSAGSCSPTVPPERDLEWTESGIEGCWRFVNRLWRITDASETGEGEDKDLDRKLHKAIAGIAADIEALGFNRAVAKVHELANAIEKATPSASRSAAARALVRLIAPMVPHLAEEAWGRLREAGLVADAAWPEHDPALLIDDEVTIAVQVNGKLRDTLVAPKGAPRDELERMAMQSDKIMKLLDGAIPRKVIVVPDRLVNIVA